MLQAAVLFSSLKKKKKKKGRRTIRFFDLMGHIHDVIIEIGKGLREEEKNHLIKNEFYLNDQKTDESGRKYDNEDIGRSAIETKSERTDR